MNQIISQHGWCLDSTMWLDLKIKFLKNNWYWFDNERGYFNGKNQNPSWLKINSKNHIRLVISHSLGIHLIKPKVLSKATHAVLINSFYSFLPKNNRRRFILKTLKRMEKKITLKDIEVLVREFISKSFLPNSVDKNFQKFLNYETKNINLKLLLDDFKKLYIENKSEKIFSKDCKILLIESGNDEIVDENSFENLKEILNQSQNEKPKVIKIDNQGHLIKGLAIDELIEEWLV